MWFANGVRTQEQVATITYSGNSTIFSSTELNASLPSAPFKTGRDQLVAFEYDEPEGQQFFYAVEAYNENGSGGFIETPEPLRVNLPTTTIDPLAPSTTIDPLASTTTNAPTTQIITTTLPPYGGGGGGGYTTPHYTDPCTGTTDSHAEITLVQGTYTPTYESDLGSAYWSGGGQYWCMKDYSVSPLTGFPYRLNGDYVYDDWHKKSYQTYESQFDDQYRPSNGTWQIRWDATLSRWLIVRSTDPDSSAVNWTDQIDVSYAGESAQKPFCPAPKIFHDDP